MAKKKKTKKTKQAENVAVMEDNENGLAPEKDIHVHEHSHPTKNEDDGDVEHEHEHAHPEEEPCLSSHAHLDEVEEAEEEIED